MAESESPSPSKSKFSIDNILQQSPLQWSTPQEAVLQLVYIAAEDFPSCSAAAIATKPAEENSSRMTLSPQFDGTSRFAHESSREAKSRTSFKKVQIQKLEEKFGEQKYLTKLDRTRLAN